ncbi:hypothetical protein GH733_008020 [Mirounga leonina]|nr:hypothetical protein GH733_008020 [Mirounga leonina]
MHFHSQAVLVDRTVYISGQLGMDPASGQLVPGGVAEEAKQISRVVFLQELLTRLLLCPKEAMWRLRQSLSKDLSQQRRYKWVQRYLNWLGLLSLLLSEVQKKKSSDFSSELKVNTCSTLRSKSCEKVATPISYFEEMKEHLL